MSQSLRHEWYENLVEREDERVVEMRVRWYTQKLHMNDLNTEYRAKSPLVGETWGLLSILHDDRVKWRENHGKGLRDHWGTEMIFDTLLEGMELIERRHAEMYEDSQLKRLTEFAEKFTTGFWHPELKECAEEALGRTFPND